MDAADPSVFDSEKRTIEIQESDLLGSHKYPNVLYTGEVDIVDVRTGETPDELDRSVQEAKSFADRTTSSGAPPRVAKAVSGERAVEGRSPYTSCVFYHYSITGGMDWHTVFGNAWESDAYSVDHTPDYSTGNLTIIVRRN